MFRFAHPDFLYLLFILPILFAFFIHEAVCFSTSKIVKVTACHVFLGNV